jgi:hypothetical protein
MSIAFSPNGNVLLTASSPKPSRQPLGDYKRVRFWRTSDYKKISAFGDGEGAFAKASFSPDGQFVAVAANPASVGVRAATGLLDKLRRQNFIPALLSKERANIFLHDVSSKTPLIRVWNTFGREEPFLELPREESVGSPFLRTGTHLHPAEPA